MRTDLVIPYVLDKLIFKPKKRTQDERKKLMKNLFETVTHSLFTQTCQFSGSPEMCMQNTHIPPVTVHSQLMCGRDNTTA